MMATVFNSLYPFNLPPSKFQPLKSTKSVCGRWRGADAMRENEERWKQLCEQAAKEHDPKKLIELTRQISA
jgi:hypothetical protein